MGKQTTEDFLIEIGVEELPTGSVPKLVNEFARLLTAQCDKQALTYADVHTFTTPRRIAVLIEQLSTQQPTREVERRGPALASAFDTDGKPTQAVLGFAKSCGVEVDALQRVQTDKGEWLSFAKTVPGQDTRDLLPELIQTAVSKLALPKRMRWGQGDDEFIRPVHWLCCLLGADVVAVQLFGVTASKQTFGHRFLAPAAITIAQAKDYQASLAEQGKVISCWQTRRQMIADALLQHAAAISAKAIIPAALLDEVTNLVEWPVVVMGEFEPDFLRVPPEVLCAVMNDHQKCFALQDGSGNLIHRFLLVSNINSQNPARLIDGNQRVMRARMADGAFFYATDCKIKLSDRVEKLAHVLYVRELGTLHDKAQRLADLNKWLAQALQQDFEQACQIGWLAKTDLLSDMVCEFPELQGVMGYYYAKAEGLPDSVALALRDQYLPDGAASAVPETTLGACISIADKVDTLVGIFGINKQPTGDKDPFATRRAANGIVRIVIEMNLDFDLLQLIQESVRSYQTKLSNPAVDTQVYDFIIDRLGAWYQEKTISVDTLNAVVAKKPTNLLDLDQRIHAVNVFRQMPEASALAAANKRVSRLLIKEDCINIDKAINSSLFESDQEKQLAKALEEKAKNVRPYLEQRDYTQALQSLSTLQQVIDDFFEHVMVMVDDEDKRTNRLALLAKLRKLFLEVADISLLQ